MDGPHPSSSYLVPSPLNPLRVPSSAWQKFSVTNDGWLYPFCRAVWFPPTPSDCCKCRMRKCPLSNPLLSAWLWRQLQLHLQMGLSAKSFDFPTTTPGCMDIMPLWLMEFLANRHLPKRTWWHFLHLVTFLISLIKTFHRSDSDAGVPVRLYIQYEFYLLSRVL